MSDPRREAVAKAIGRARFPKYGPGPASEYDLRLADAALAAIAATPGPVAVAVSEAEVRKAAWALIAACEQELDENRLYGSSVRPLSQENPYFRRRVDPLIDRLEAFLAAWNAGEGVTE